MLKYSFEVCRTSVPADVSVVFELADGAHLQSYLGMAELSAYDVIPSKIIDTNRKEFGMQKLAERSDEFVETFLKNVIGSKPLEQGLLEKLRLQSVLLDPAYKTHKAKETTRLHKRLSAKKKREMKLYEIPKAQQSYDQYLPLHNLWKDYVTDLLQPSKTSNPSHLSQKVLKADYHGAIIKVVRSKCSSCVGKEGILLQETQNTLKLICRDNKIRTIPKANSVFAFGLDGFLFTLYGNHMRYRTGERSARKFKDKTTVDL
ncbi:hypothetical protein EMCRGX_G031030 [Ephydatia muelleri]